MTEMPELNNGVDQVSGVGSAPGFSSCFDKRASQALKGIAILMMMLHHNFRSSSLYTDFNVSFFPFQEHQIVNLALSFKICVSIFAFISGYGLFLSYRNSKINASWTVQRYIRTFSGYWFVWFLSAVICQIIDGRTTWVLWSDNLSKNIINVLIDFLGLAKLFNTPTLNGTWWYMSAAAVFILLTPVLYKFRNNLWLVLIIPSVAIRIIHTNGSSAFTGENSVFAFLSPFILGAIFANYNYFDKWCSIGSSKKTFKFIKCAAEIVLLIIMYKIYHGISISSFWEFHLGIYPVVLILFCVEFIIPVRIVKETLVFLGKHSMNVFLVHTFIRYYYWSGFTYYWKHFLVICFVLLLISVAISLVIEKAKSLSRYDKLIDKLISLITVH